MSEISELFDRDPLHMSEQDIATIVAYEREHQARHELGVKPPAKPRKPSTKTADMLKDLGLMEVGTSLGEIKKTTGLEGDDLLKALGLK